MSPQKTKVAVAPRTLEPSDIRDCISVAPFRLSAREFEPDLSRPASGSPDFVIELEWEGQIQRFAVEYKSQSTPKQVEAALQQIRRYTRESSTDAPMIVTPYLRPDLLDRLVAESVSGIDLSGNYAVVVPGRWLVIRTGSTNKYPSTAPIKNVYRGKSSLVARALLLRRQFPLPPQRFKRNSPS